MAQTFLDYLTLPNPGVDASKCKEGKSTKSKRVYGPHKVREWEDVTLKNLNASFGDVLLQGMGSPRVRDANDVPSEKTVLFEEGSVTTLAAHWNEPVVDHALNGTCEILREGQTGGHLHGALGSGRVHFIENTGQGHLPDEKKRIHKPDWCVYQGGQVGDERVANLVPGDSKPAMKWKSEWIKSTNPRLKSKGKMGIQQVTKYMYLAKTRYSFLLTEEELVPVRLSKCFRDLEIVKERIEDAHRREQIIDTSGSFETGDEENDEITSDISRDPDQESDRSYADATRTIDLVLEYCRIPWSNSGTNELTVNLTLWWLPLLAIQGSSIKGLGAYTSLGERMRGHSPEFVEQQAEGETNEEEEGKQPANTRKRRAEEMEGLEQDTRRYRTRRHSINNSPATSFISVQTRSTSTRASSQSSRATAERPRHGRGFSRGSKRSRSNVAIH